jgi:ubiquinone/menaquinone biosynthesis C-methylase UbiE
MQYEFKHVRAGDIDLAYVEYGRGAPVVLLHGSGHFDQLPPSIHDRLMANARLIGFEPTDISEVVTDITRDDAATIQTPTLVLTGEQSQQMFLLVSEALARCLPNMERAQIADASHLMHVMNPQVFNATVLAFWPSTRTNPTWRCDMSASETGQVTRDAAEVYEEFFVPALFQQWAQRVADAADIRAGERVLDVACGTGVLARAVTERAGQDGTVIGLDLNEGMLAVARRKAPEIEWRHGRAESLPFDSNSFDAVVSQFGLMFFEDRATALREMMRVLRPGGRLAVAVWAALEDSPGYAALTDLLQRLFGDRAADALRAPFVLANPQTLRSLFDESGIHDVHITTRDGTARFPSIESWIYTEIKGWTLADMIDDAQYERLLAEAQRVLQPFVGADGAVAFSLPAHIVTATKT